MSKNEEAAIVGILSWEDLNGEGDLTGIFAAECPDGSIRHVFCDLSFIEEQLETGDLDFNTALHFTMAKACHPNKKGGPA